LRQATVHSGVPWQPTLYGGTHHHVGNAGGQEPSAGGCGKWEGLLIVEEAETSEIYLTNT